MTIVKRLQDCNSGLQRRDLQDTLCKESLRKGHERKLKPVTSTAGANIRHSQAPCQINIKSHTRGLFILAPIIQYIMSGFQ